MFCHLAANHHELTQRVLFVSPQLVRSILFTSLATKLVLTVSQLRFNVEFVQLLVSNVPDVVTSPCEELQKIAEKQATQSKAIKMF